jgi:hypothetical protein
MYEKRKMLFILRWHVRGNRINNFKLCATKLFTKYINLIPRGATSGATAIRTSAYRSPPPLHVVPSKHPHDAFAVSSVSAWDPVEIPKTPPMREITTALQSL